MMLILIFSLFLNVLLAHLEQPLFLNFGMLEVKNVFFLSSVPYYDKRIWNFVVPTSEASALHGSKCDVYQQSNVPRELGPRYRMALKTSEFLVIILFGHTIVVQCYYDNFFLKWNVFILFPRYKIIQSKEAWAETSSRLQRGVNDITKKWNFY